MKSWILAGATILLMQGLEAREHWGPPPLCPSPKVDCCPKPKCAPAPCPKPCAPAKPAECKPCQVQKPECKPCPEQPCPPTQMCPSPDPCCPPSAQPVLYAAYNYPAVVRTQCPYEVIINASFIYWQPVEDNLEVGYLNKMTSSTATPFAATAPVDASLQQMDFSYKPGFKVGLGSKFAYDNWDLHAEYTWFHNTHSKNVSVASPHAGEQIFPLQGIPFSGQFATSGVSSGTAGNVFNAASGDWQLKMDIVDLDLGRWNYSGMKLTFRPSLGLRVAFIDQQYDLTYTNSANFGIGFADVEKVTRSSNSYALGPRLALDSHWAFGYGLRLFGNAEADLLYTRYTTLSFKETHTAATSGTNVVSGTVTVQDDPIGVLRTHVDVALGLGWGSYFACNRFYFDLAASYEFQVFFDQNMFRKFVDTTNWLSSLSPNGNLYVQGLTVTARFDF